MLKHIYTCDRCKSSQESMEQFFSLSITIKRYSVGHNPHNSPLRQIDVCRKCVDEIGIWREEPKQPDQPKPPSTEELLQEILSRCGMVNPEE